MSRFLTDMGEASEARAARLSLPDCRAAAADQALPPPLRRVGFDLIAEVKFTSPAEGALAAASVEATRARVAGYVRAGAAAISVLTEPTRFGGSLDHLRAAASIAAVPVMRKDFPVRPVQLFEARAAGAGGALVIVRMVSDSLLREMLDAAEEAGLWVLLEAFDAADLDRIAALPRTRAVLCGVNARDLQTLQVDQGRFSAMAPHLPGERVAVAESGLGTPEEIAMVATLGYRMALVGSALMRAAAPETLLAEMVQAGRQACS